MPRRSILSAAELDGLIVVPKAKDELIRHYTFNEADLAIIRQRRGPANRLGFAILLCYMRFPCVMLSPEEEPYEPLLDLVAAQLKIPVESWAEYGQRAETRREHLLELQSVFGFRSFSMQDYGPSVNSLGELAWQTDKGIVLATALVERLRRQAILLPSASVVERMCAEAITNANRRIYKALTDSLSTDVWMTLCCLDTCESRKRMGRKTLTFSATRCLPPTSSRPISTKILRLAEPTPDRDWRRR